VTQSPTPALDGVYEKLRRAKQHAERMYELVEHIQRPYGYRFSGTVSSDGLVHTYVAVEPEPMPGDVPLLFGDAIHNLRCALDLQDRDAGQ
jgi:hypothetical protein